jgi:hypothetical protein
MFSHHDYVLVLSIPIPILQLGFDDDVLTVEKDYNLPAVRAFVRCTAQLHVLPYRTCERQTVFLFDYFSALKRDRRSRSIGGTSGCVLLTRRQFHHAEIMLPMEYALPHVIVQGFLIRCKTMICKDTTGSWTGSMWVHSQCWRSL